MIRRANIPKIEVSSYKGRRWPLWVKILAVLVLAGALSFGSLLGVVLSGAHDHISGCLLYTS